MKEFLLLFRTDRVAPELRPSPEELQAMMKPWQDWLGSIAAQNKMANPGARLSWQGKVVRPDKVVTNGPYVETKEAVGGFIIIKSATIEDATELAKGCPILMAGGNVEVRPFDSND